MSDRLDVPVDGGRLAAFRMAAPVPDSERVLAIHGITSSSRTWLATARALGDRAGLLAVDLRGRAASAELDGPFGLDAHVRDMIAVLDAAGIRRAVVTGHSLGAYVAARLASRHPDRVSWLVLVDGGLTIPETAEVDDPEAFLRTFLGPTLDRLEMTFPDVATYRRWWGEHPAFAAPDVLSADLDAYAAHDLVGEPGQMRSSINPQVVRDDGLDLLGAPDADQLAVPATLLVAPRGMVDDPHPMQPIALAQAWAAADPGRREAVQVPDVNHYTIVFGASGASSVAEAIAAAAAAAAVARA